MGNIFMNFKNSKASDPHRLLLNLPEKINLINSNFIIYYTWKNIKKWYKNNKFKISSSSWNEVIELPDGSYSISDILDYFEYILKNMGIRLSILQ